MRSFGGSGSGRWAAERETAACNVMGNSTSNGVGGLFSTAVLGRTGSVDSGRGGARLFLLLLVLVLTVMLVVVVSVVPAMPVMPVGLVVALVALVVTLVLSRLEMALLRRFPSLFTVKTALTGDAC